MLKINELNKAFKEKSLFTTVGSYNDLLGYARGMARNLDSRDGRIREWKEMVYRLECSTRKLKTEIRNLEIKYVRSIFRDPKTGRYLKRKK